MAFLNPGFETESATQLGYPDDWTVAITFTAADHCEFDDGAASEAGFTPREDFAGEWSTNQDYIFTFDEPINFSQLELALFNIAMQSFDNFETEWLSNQTAIFDFVSEEYSWFSSLNNAATTGLATGPFDLTVGSPDISITTEQGSATSIPIPALAADVTGAGGLFSFGDVTQRIAVQIDGQVPAIQIDLANETTLGAIVTKINAAYFAEHGINPCSDNGGQLRFQGVILGTDSKVLLFNFDPAVHIAPLGLAPYALSDGDSLQVQVDGQAAQTIVFNAADFFNIASAGAAEVAAVIDRDLNTGSSFVVTDSVAIQSERTDGASKVQVLGGTANVALGFSATAIRNAVFKMGHTSGTITGTGPVADLSSVTILELVAYLNADANMASIGAGFADISGSLKAGSESKEINASIDLPTGLIATEAGFIGFGAFNLSVFQQADDFDRWIFGGVLVDDWDNVTAEAATFDPSADPYENFSQSVYYLSWIFGTDTALYNLAVDSEENFEPAKAGGEMFTVDPSNDRLFRSNHALTAGHTISFYNEGGQLPTPMIAGYEYLIQSVINVNEWIIWNGTTVVNITDAGVGTHFYIPDRSRFWTTFLQNI